MNTRLRRFQHKNCYKFIERLMRLKRRISNKDELRYLLEELHRSFLRLKLSIGIEPYAKESLEEPKIQKTGTEIVKYEVGPFTFLAIDEKIVGLEDPYYQALEPFIVNKSVIEISLIARMYADYKTRHCDLCGSYFYAGTFEAPLGRMLEADFISAFHYPCKNRGMS
ncbi:hypothetical protein PAEPH01_1767 [Pancytospora epiphaga]|nr:hypothetical protein PAEPH01_1767 [Pancytospora epiphaga]